MSKQACQLYQLRSKSRVADGAYVGVNGPWDRFGYVVSSTDKGDHWLHLVRGCKQRPGDTPVIQF